MLDSKKWKERESHTKSNARGLINQNNKDMTADYEIFLCVFKYQNFLLFIFLGDLLKKDRIYLSPHKQALIR